jgi:hypothetical protein
MTKKKTDIFKYPDKFWPGFWMFMERHRVYGLLLLILAMLFFAGFKVSTKYFSIEKERNQILKAGGKLK